MSLYACSIREEHTAEKYHFLSPRQIHFLESSWGIIKGKSWNSWLTSSTPAFLFFPLLFLPWRWALGRTFLKALATLGFIGGAFSLWSSFSFHEINLSLLTTLYGFSFICFALWHSFVTMVCILCHTIFLYWQIEAVMNNLVENGMFVFFFFLPMLW